MLSSGDFDAFLNEVYFWAQKRVYFLTKAALK